MIEVFPIDQRNCRRGSGSSFGVAVQNNQKMFTLTAGGAIHAVAIVQIGHDLTKRQVTPFDCTGAMVVTGSPGQPHFAVTTNPRNAVLITETYP